MKAALGKLLAFEDAGQFDAPEYSAACEAAVAAIKGGKMPADQYQTQEGKLVTLEAEVKTMQATIEKCEVEVAKLQ